MTGGGRGRLLPDRSRDPLRSGKREVSGAQRDGSFPTGLQFDVQLPHELRNDRGRARGQHAQFCFGHGSAVGIDQTDREIDLHATALELASRRQLASSHDGVDDKILFGLQLERVAQGRGKRGAVLDCPGGGNGRQSQLRAYLGTGIRYISGGAR